METLDNLHQRDKVGVDDFVLLEDFENKDSFLENLQKRYKENIIYVSFDGNLFCLVLTKPFSPSDVHWPGVDFGESL